MKKNPQKKKNTKPKASSCEILNENKAIKKSQAFKNETCFRCLQSGYKAIKCKKTPKKHVIVSKNTCFNRKLERERKKRERKRVKKRKKVKL